jgi:hypothetical protein
MMLFLGEEALALPMEAGIGMVPSLVGADNKTSSQRNMRAKNEMLKI